MNVWKCIAEVMPLIPDDQRASVVKFGIGAIGLTVVVSFFILGPKAGLIGAWMLRWIAKATGA